MAVDEQQSSPASALAVEQNGINVIAESERRGWPRDLFWPWCAANISVLAISYGSFLLGFGISFWQGVFAGVVGTVFSFLLVGIVSLAGKRGSAPTMVLSRAPFGVRGNGLPTAISYLLLVGWETVLVTLATLATATVFGRLGWSDGDVTKVIAFLVVAAIIIVVGCLGFAAIMRLQTWLTVVLAVLTVGYIALTLDEIDWDAVTALPSGSGKAVLGALILAATALGLGWVNAGADYSRYQARGASSRGVVWWTTFGGSIAPVVLIVYGLLLAGSDPELSVAIAADPIGALTLALPTWFLLPFAVVAVFGLVAGAVLDIYSSGLALLTLGVRIPRWSAALIDGVIMVIGTIWLVFFADDVLGPFQAFLITLGVPIAAWCGVFIADLLLRRQGLHGRRSLPLVRPLWRLRLGRRRAGRGGDIPRLGACHQLRRRVRLAWLPARPVRARRQAGRLGVRQPRCARGPRGGVHRLLAARPWPRALRRRRRVPSRSR